MKLSSWPEIGSDGDVLLTAYVAKGITGYDDDDASYVYVYIALTYRLHEIREMAWACERTYTVHIRCWSVEMFSSRERAMSFFW